LGMDGLDALWILLALAALPLLHRLADERVTNISASLYAYFFLVVILAFWLRLDANIANAFIYFQF